MNGCGTPEKQYLPVTKDSSPEGLANNPQKGSNYLFSTIEFDDQGEMWQREQLYRTLDLISDFGSNGYPVTLIVFVHGWKHDASTNSSNYRDFRRFIMNFAAAQSGTAERRPDHAGSKPRQIVGVYISWRGNLYRRDRDYPGWVEELPLDLSFWNRKRVASQVAGVSSTEAILSLAAQTRLSDAGHGPEEASKVILIGHSFGGLLLERAVTQAMLGSMLTRGQTAIDDRRSEADYARRASEDYDCWQEKDDEITPQKQSYDVLTAAIQATNAVITDLSSNLDLLTAKTPAAIDVCSKGTNLLNIWDPLFATSNAPFAMLTNRLDKAKLSGVKDKNKWRHTISEADLKVESFSEKGAKSLDTGLTNSFASIRLDTTFLTNVLGDKRVGELTLDSGVLLTNTIRTLLKGFSQYNEEARGFQILLSAYREYNPRKAKATIDLERVQKATNSMVAEQKKLEERLADLQGKSDKCRTNYEFNHAMALYYHNRIIKPPADLVLLVNPASESIVAKKMIAALYNPLVSEYGQAANQEARPWIISIGSRADKPNRLVFPVGQFLGSWDERLRMYTKPQLTNQFILETRPTNAKWPGKTGTYSSRTAAAQAEWAGLQSSTNFQRTYYQSTAPENWLLVSHTIASVRTNVNLELATTYTNPLEWSLNVNLSPESSIFNPTNEFVVAASGGTSIIYVISNRIDRLNNSGYWIIRAPDELIPGHNDIFTTNFYAMAAALYRISQAFGKGPQTNGIVDSGVLGTVNRPKE